MSTPDPAAPQALEQLLATSGKNSRRARLWRWGLALLVVAGLLAWLVARERAAPQDTTRYVTEAASTGNLVVTASASGTLQPTKSVDVGSELSGTVTNVLVDENDRVKKGQVLARLDTARLNDAVARSRAALAAAQAAVRLADATQAEARAALARMRQVAELSGGKVPAKAELDTAEASLLRADANAASARANVDQARAALTTDETNLSKAEIRSPVDGVVLTRKVEPGNTVVAAMNSPVLFVIAEDLARMDLQVKVDEADVANVKPGQEVSFTVAAWPGRRFPASIQRVGLGSTITDNVVTYKTVLRVDNRDLALRPGMTATAAIVTARRQGVLLVPNAALRFAPPAPAAATPEGGILTRLLPRTPRPARPQRQVEGDQQRVWVLENGMPQPVAVTPGVSDGRHTEISAGELKAGMAVITDIQAAKP